MALIPCLNCGHQISEGAVKCPKCDHGTLQDILNNLDTSTLNVVQDEMLPSVGVSKMNRAEQLYREVLALDSIPEAQDEILPSDEQSLIPPEAVDSNAVSNKNLLVEVKSLSKKLKSPYVFVPFLFVSVCFIGYHFYQVVKFNGLMAQANELIEKHNYQDGCEVAGQAHQLDAQKGASLQDLCQILLKSDDNFQQALTLENANLWEDALPLFLQVVQEDKKNFDLSIKKIANVKEKISLKRLNDAKFLFVKKKFEEAYQKLSVLLIDNEKFKPALALKNNYAKAAAKQKQEREQQQLATLLNQVNSMNIAPATEQLESYIKEGHPAALIKQAQDKLAALANSQKLMLERIEELKRTEYYSKAIEDVQGTLVLDTNQKSALTSELQELKAAHIAKMEKLKAEGEQRAREFAMDAVRKELNSPSTAEFVNTGFYLQEYPHYGVVVTVDAQNAFGAMLRSTFIACITITGEDSYKLNHAVDLVSSGSDSDYVPNYAILFCKNSINN